MHLDFGPLHAGRPAGISTRTVSAALSSSLHARSCLFVCPLAAYCYTAQLPNFNFTPQIMIKLGLRCLRLVLGL